MFDYLNSKHYIWKKTLDTEVSLKEYFCSLNFYYICDDKNLIKLNIFSYKPHKIIQKWEIIAMNLKISIRGWI